MVIVYHLDIMGIVIEMNIKILPIVLNAVIFA